jgi:hypothetical protein
MSSAATWIMYTRTMEDSATVDDEIISASVTKNIFETISDSVTIDDEISSIVKSNIF